MPSLVTANSFMPRSTPTTAPVGSIGWISTLVQYNDTKHLPDGLRDTVAFRIRPLTCLERTTLTEPNLGSWMCFSFSILMFALLAFVTAIFPMFENRSLRRTLINFYVFQKCATFGTLFLLIRSFSLVCHPWILFIVITRQKVFRIQRQYFICRQTHFQSFLEKLFSIRIRLRRQTQTAYER